jgi:hypothetical protein
MSPENSKRAEVKQKITHELEELLVIFLYLAFFFCAITTYKMLILHEFHVSYFSYGTALINALIIAKVILIGQYAHRGRRHESKPLLVSAINKAFLFGLLVFVFHFIEEAIKRLWHGEKLVGALHGINIDDALARTLVIFGTFIPLFGCLEIRRLLGEEKFRSLLFRG